MHLAALFVLGMLILDAESMADQSDQEVTPAKPAELAKSYGYLGETHEITTTDGYILTAFRIVNSSALNRYLDPFILQHGMSSNAGQWIAIGRDQSLAFILADNGYDVWLSNTRGSMHSRRHTTLSPDSAEFWDYSFHEKGVLDMPATVDYVLNTTSHQQVFYVGHSQGTTIFFIMNSMKPEYNKKIRHAFALAPAAYMSHAAIVQAATPQMVQSVEVIGKTFYENHFRSDYVMMNLLKFGICNVLYYACGQTVNAMFGFNPRFNLKNIQPGLTFFPDFVSVGEFTHYGQFATQPFTFRMYDYREMNMVKYQAREPPKYPIRRITTSVNLIYSSNDNCVAVKDVERFNHDIPNGQLYLVPDSNFNHLDFAFSPSAKHIIYYPIVQTANSYHKNTKF